MLSIVKTVERAEARRLRKDQGRSIKEIARLLGVSRSSVSLWVRDIELTPEQESALSARDPARNHARNGWAANRERGRLRRRGYQLAGRRRARRLEPLFVAGCMLYWAEGWKCRSTVQLTNADPEVIRLFARFLRECFGVPDDRMRLACHLFADHLSRQREIEQFWLDVVDLPRSFLQKSMVNKYSRPSQRKWLNALPYGTCKLIVHSTEILQTIYGSIQELGGFSRPGWLD
jgi:transcriptional regulator with XRE-family HTH domain